MYHIYPNHKLCPIFPHIAIMLKFQNELPFLFSL